MYTDGHKHCVDIRHVQYRVIHLVIYRPKSITDPKQWMFCLNPESLQGGKVLGTPITIFRRKIKLDGKLFAVKHGFETLYTEPPKKLPHVQLYLPYHYYHFSAYRKHLREGYHKVQWLAHKSKKYGVHFYEKILSTVEIEEWKQEAISTTTTKIRLSRAIKRLQHREQELAAELIHLDPSGVVEKNHKIAQEAIYESISPMKGLKIAYT